MSPVIQVPVTRADRDTCDVSGVLSRVGEKWSVLILALLAERPYGFNELDRAVEGLSRRILTRTLRLLEADGLIEREVTETPARVEYRITGLGRSLLPLVLAIGRWAVEHAGEIAAAQARFTDAGRASHEG
ncbi:DNA-binding HxlR family transcriptional regulator [Actinoplanes lutulentus]|uniref:HxlR family transcriptional regulator n=1 Tax=Actinoplanes lutulentus TaxID=1287878 RepID=A0A327Z131_9ACTN|nr:helix-turn-helix domain-containing protein [Actinoplanes lutulentus]MBB2943176.1 DNA-binding HxlR family transcriptional regulator [Actinoplanes lutulentus]RAK28242.1 HxlR family transcriptional regulator [Actinoplanes lutulentus]